MGRAGRVGLTVAGLVLGAATGYLAERAVLRRRLLAPAGTLAPLGSIAGEPRELRGPDGTRIHVETYGPADGPQLILSHGFTCTGRVWHEQVVGLADRYRLITYDQPGHGRSSAPASGTYSIELLGDALATVAAHATRAGPVVLAGHSLGGMTVLDALRRHEGLAARTTGVVLLSTTSHARPEAGLELGITAAARLERVIRRAVPWVRDRGGAQLAARTYTASTDLSFVLTRFFATGRAADPRVVDFTEQLVLDSDPDMILALVSPILRLDADAALDGLRAPTTIVVGDTDHLTPASLSRRMAERCGVAELVELPGIGHMSQLEAPAEVNALLAHHLDRAAGLAEVA